MTWPIVAIVGATGTGKSDLSLALAERFARDGVVAEVVNADAMQLYRGMDIGTAKLSVDERRGVEHHLFDHLAVTDEASVAAYQGEARRIIADIQGRGAVPLLVGGSGLYVSSVIFDFQFPVRDAAIRAALERELDEWGVGALARRLADADPEAARAIGPHNGRRIVRALEVIELTGVPVSGQLPDQPVAWRPSHIVALSDPRERLTARLDARVERMWQNGLIDEVRGLIPLGLERGVTASRAIGYAQALGEIHGILSRSEAVDQAQALTRRYARRQVSWFKRYRDAHWLEAADPALVDAAWQVVNTP